MRAIRSLSVEIDHELVMSVAFLKTMAFVLIVLFYHCL